MIISLIYRLLTIVVPLQAPSCMLIWVTNISWTSQVIVVSTLQCVYLIFVSNWGSSCLGLICNQLSPESQRIYIVIVVNRLFRQISLRRVVEPWPITSSPALKLRMVLLVQIGQLAVEMCSMMATWAYIVAAGLNVLLLSQLIAQMIIFKRLIAHSLWDPSSSITVVVSYMRWMPSILMLISCKTVSLHNTIRWAHSASLYKTILLLFDEALVLDLAIFGRKLVELHVGFSFALY